MGVIGVGYVGLVTGAGFSEMGNEVYCMDIDEQKISNLKNGIIPIYEPGLTDLVKSNMQKGRLHFTTNLKELVEKNDILIIAVGTPSDDQGNAELKYVFKVAEEIGEYMNGYKVIVTKSTVPVGTNHNVAGIISNKIKSRKIDCEFDQVSNPEFLKEGAAIEDFMRPNRIVVGSESDRAKRIMDEAYEPFVRNGHPIYHMELASAEFTKYAANSMLAAKISIMNEFSRLCEKVGANINDVRRGIGSDKRIGMDFLYAGVGFGGSCFPKDLSAIITTARQNKTPLSILESVKKANLEQRTFFINKILDHYDNDITGKTFAIWGLAFKPGTDDMREAPSIEIIKELTARGARIQAYDPVAIDAAKKEFVDMPNIVYLRKPYDAIEGAEALILLTEWREFREPDFEKMANLMKAPVVFDGRNQYNPEKMKKYNYTYYSIGRPLRSY